MKTYHTRGNLLVIATDNKTRARAAARGFDRQNHRAGNDWHAFCASLAPGSYLMDYADETAGRITGWAVREVLDHDLTRLPVKAYPKRDRAAEMVDAVVARQREAAR